MANEQNLIKNEDLTPSQRRENAKKAGKASVEARRKRKAMKEQLETILSLPLTLKDNKGNTLVDKYKKLGIEENEIDNQMAISIELFLAAIGDSKVKIQAIKTIREIVQDEKLSSQDNEIRVVIVNDLNDEIMK